MLSCGQNFWARENSNSHSLLFGQGTTLHNTVVPWLHVILCTSKTFSLSSGILYQQPVYTDITIS